MYTQLFKSSHILANAQMEQLESSAFFSFDMDKVGLTN